MSDCPVALDDPALELRGETAMLRRWQLRDAPFLAEGWADPAVRRWTSPPVDCSVDAARAWISADPDRCAAGVSVDLVVCTAADSRPVGEVGLAPIDWNRQAAQVGYWLLPCARGRGTATAGLGLLAGWAVQSLCLKLLVARCHRANLGSIAVAEGAGFRYERDDPQGFALYVCRA